MVGNIYGVFLLQIHTVLNTITLACLFISGGSGSSSFFFLRVALAILRPLLFIINFRISLRSMKNYDGILIRDTLNL